MSGLPEAASLCCLVSCVQVAGSWVPLFVSGSIYKVRVNIVAYQRPRTASLKLVDSGLGNVLCGNTSHIH